MIYIHKSLLINNIMTSVEEHRKQVMLIKISNEIV